MLDKEEIVKRLNMLKESKEGDFTEVKEQLLVDEWWDHPKENESIQGIYLETRQFTKKLDGKKFNSIILATENGVYGISENIILKKRLHEPSNCDPIKEGDGLNLVYLGKKQSRNSINHYHDYTVRIRSFSNPNNNNVNNKNGLSMYDEPEVEEIIQLIKEELSAEKGGNVEPTVDEVINLATAYCEEGTVEGLDDQMLLKIKNNMAMKIKNGEKPF